jgi:hypothetical protein
MRLSTGSIREIEKRENDALRAASLIDPHQVHRKPETQKQLKEFNPPSLTLFNYHRLVQFGAASHRREAGQQQVGNRGARQHRVEAVHDAAVPR